ncbi:MAG: hypothetical protein P4L33_22180 [Capsulimonadaceae bacterium]|nr:hypothetical protein [Capsulimonadaceae bacterium]
MKHYALLHDPKWAISARPGAIALCVTVIIGLCASTGIARADVTIVEKVTMTKVDPTSVPPSPPNSGPIVSQGVTLYFKGANARSELDSGQVTIYDGANEKVYTLDPSTKTYFLRPLKNIEVAPQNPTGYKPVSMTTEDAITITQGDETQTFAGTSARAFIISGTVTVRPEQIGGGHHRRSDGYGGGEPDGDSGSPDASSPFDNSGARTVEVSGEVWLSETVKIPNDKKATLFPALFVEAQPDNFVFKPLADKLAKKKEIPLDSRVSVTHSTPYGTNITVTTSTLATSLSQASLPDSLFHVPVGYTEVPVPDRRPQR